MTDAICIGFLTFFACIGILLLATNGIMLYLYPAVLYIVGFAEGILAGVIIYTNERK
jgi:hypothetical protein